MWDAQSRRRRSGSGFRASGQHHFRPPDPKGRSRRSTRFRGSTCVHPLHRGPMQGRPLAPATICTGAKGHGGLSDCSAYSERRQYHGHMHSHHPMGARDGFAGRATTVTSGAFHKQATTWLANSRRLLRRFLPKRVLLSEPATSLGQVRSESIAGCKTYCQRNSKNKQQVQHRSRNIYCLNGKRPCL